MIKVKLIFSSAISVMALGINSRGLLLHRGLGILLYPISTGEAGVANKYSYTEVV